MKTFTTFLTILTAALIALPAHAASFLISPTPETTSPGNIVSVIVPFNPGNTTIYSVMLEITYPNQFLDGSSFVVNQNAGTPMRIIDHPRFTSVDDERGLMRVTIGFPGGIRDPLILGRATFIADGEGIGTISVSPSSQALDQNGNNVHEPFLLVKTIESSSGGGGSSTTEALGATGLTTVNPFTQITVPPAASPGSGSAAGGGGASVALSSSGSSGQALDEEATSTAGTTTGVTTANLQASVAEATDGSGTNTVLLGILIVLVIASIASALFGLFKRS